MKKLAPVILPILAICCCAIGFFYPLARGAVLISDGAAGERLLPVTLIAGDLTASPKIDINSATEEDLCSLPGIGKSKAASIIDYRKLNGKFKDIEEIQSVQGIGTEIYNNIRMLICTEKEE